MKPTTVKDRIADMMRAEGYDFMTAYEHADKCVAEFLASGRKRETYYCGHSSITLRVSKKRANPLAEVIPMVTI